MTRILIEFFSDSVDYPIEPGHIMRFHPEWTAMDLTLSNGNSHIITQALDPTNEAWSSKNGLHRQFCNIMLYIINHVAVGNVENYIY